MTAWWWAHSAGETSRPQERAQFETQDDAEAWLGQGWEDLLDAGVEEVWLMNGNAAAYGPMPLNA